MGDGEKAPPARLFGVDLHNSLAAAGTEIEANIHAAPPDFLGVQSCKASSRHCSRAWSDDRQVDSSPGQSGAQFVEHVVSHKCHLFVFGLGRGATTRTNPAPSGFSGLTATCRFAS